MENLKKYSVIVVSVVLVIFSLVVFFSARAFSSQGSYIEVKGLSEKIVKADTAIWSISFDANSNDIDSLYNNIDTNTKAVKSFLVSKGFDPSEISVAPVNIYQDTYKDSLYQYHSTTQISVYTKKVDLVKSSESDTLTLVKEGVSISQNSIDFQFSDINSVKPEMLTEAIKNAKDTAVQFAKESSSRLGNVVRGNQGVFDITDKDPGSPEYKKIRVVSTLRFLLN